MTWTKVVPGSYQTVARKVKEPHGDLVHSRTYGGVSCVQRILDRWRDVALMQARVTSLCL